jgi:RHS repeat-associated protein
LNILANGDIPITKNGFLYIYVSNETQNWDVFFDNLSVKHYTGPIAEETHYYPFGLTMAGISSKALKFNYAENKKKYNGIEYENSFDLNIGEAFFRINDPQLGRWWQIDPKPTEMFSPYVAMNNNPLLLGDPMGDTTWLYNQNGVNLGVIPDNLKNQVHFMETEGDAGTQISTKGLSKKEINNIGKTFRQNSIAFIGSKTASKMREITDQAVSNKKEIGFVGTIGKDKEIRLTALPIDERNKLGEAPLEAQINSKYPTAAEQSKLFLFGHTHVKGFVLGFTGGDNSPMGSQKTFGDPTDPADYANFLYRNNNSSEKGRSPALLTTPWGITIYGSEQTANKGTNNSYILYKSLK